MYDIDKKRSTVRKVEDSRRGMKSSVTIKTPELDPEVFESVNLVCVSETEEGGLVVCGRGTPRFILMASAALIESAMSLMPGDGVLDED